MLNWTFSKRTGFRFSSCDINTKSINWLAKKTILNYFLVIYMFKFDVLIQYCFVFTLRFIRKSSAPLNFTSQNRSDSNWFYFIFFWFQTSMTCGHIRKQTTEDKHNWKWRWNRLNIFILNLYECGKCSSSLDFCNALTCLDRDSSIDSNSIFVQLI